MPPPQCLGLGVDFMTYPDDTNLPYIVDSSSGVIHDSMMVHMFMSPSISIDNNILVLLTVNLAFIRQHFC